jgi:hypothetical protein
MKQEMTRKEFLQVLCVGLAAGAGGTLLASCAKKEDTPQTTAQKTPTKSASADPCADLSALTPQDLTMRNETLKYTAKSTDPEKQCSNCKFWQAPEGGAVCGACTLIKGPINPKGYCTSWFTNA